MVALAILEGAATAEAQRHLRTSDFTRLRKIAGDMESQDDPVRFGKLNRRLHETSWPGAATPGCSTCCADVRPAGPGPLDHVHLPARARRRGGARTRPPHRVAGERRPGRGRAIARWHKLQTVEAYRARRD